MKNKKEIIKLVEETIECLQNEGDLEREDVIHPAGLNMIEFYFKNELEKDEMITALDYLGVLKEYDLTAIDKEKSKKTKRKIVRKACK